MSAPFAVLSPRSASIFAALADAAVAPEEAVGLPPVSRTDAVRSFDAWLAAGPRLNAKGLVGALYALELAPLALGRRHRLRRLRSRAERTAVLADLDRRAPGPLRGLVDVVVSTAQISYYGDDAVMRKLGYDADAVVARGRALRAAEGRRC